MQASEMICGRLYKRKNGKVINLQYETDSGETVIVSEPGEDDTQSMIGIPGEEEVVEVTATSYSGHCPSCARRLFAFPRNHPNPHLKAHNAQCDCGWLGEYVHR
jgi:hypothetical protein